MLNRTPIILYGAGSGVIPSILRFQSQGLTPIYICDSDKKKHGMTIMGIEVVSLETAFSEHPDCEVYVAVSSNARFEIFDMLISNGIGKDRILNYKNYEKRLGCIMYDDHFVANGSGSALMCCKGSTVSRKRPSAVKSDDYKTFSEFTNAFLTARKNLINGFGSSESPCRNCECLKYGYYASDYMIKYINFMGEGKCNINCSYCSDRKYIVLPDSFVKNLPELVDNLEKLALTDKDTKIAFARGELCVQPDLRDIIKVLRRYESVVYTNATVFNQDLCDLIRDGMSSVNVSLDSGTRDTYAKIKDIDAFDRVCENIKKYSVSEHSVHLKYVCLPQINDNKEDADGFVKICAEMKPYNISLSREYFKIKFGEIPVNTLEMIRFMYRQLRNLNLNVRLMKELYSKEELHFVLAD
jgi:pyruvate-formate lyase-activating enzyme